MVKTALFTTLFVCFFNCVFEVKPANAVVDPADFVLNIFDNTRNLKTEKIQPDIKPDGLLNAKTENIQPKIPKFPTKKTEKLIPEMKIVNDVRGELFLDVNKYKKEFSNPENIKKSFMYMVGADIIEEKFKKKSNSETKKTNTESSGGVNIVSLGTASKDTDMFGKQPAVPLYGKTPFINNPIEDLGDITGNYLNDIAPIHGVMPKISKKGEIIDDVNSYLDDTIDLFEGDSKPTPDKVMDSKIIIFD